MSKQTTKTAASSKTADRALVKNVQIGKLVQNVRFARKVRKDGEVIVFAKTRDLPKLAIRRLNSKEVVGHIAGQRDEIKATATTERSVFEKLVDAVWAKKPGKNTWHPTVA